MERLIASGAFASGKEPAAGCDLSLPELHPASRAAFPALQGGPGRGKRRGGTAGRAPDARTGLRSAPPVCEPDGTFPNHPPDPSEAENLRELADLVRREGCDVGVAFDGDGDRLGIVDERGEIVSPDLMLLLYAREALRNGPGKAVFEVRCSEALFDGVRKFGGIPVMSKCGNTSILPRMHQERAVIGGELSGHIFFNDPPFEFDDALYAAALLLRYMDRCGNPLSSMFAELWAGLPDYVSSPEIRVDCPDYLKWDVVDALRDVFARKYRVIDIDRAQVYFEKLGARSGHQHLRQAVLRFEDGPGERRADEGRGAGRVAQAPARLPV